MTLIASCEGEHGEEHGVDVGTELRPLMGSDTSALISRRHSPVLNAVMIMPTRQQDSIHISHSLLSLKR